VVSTMSHVLNNNHNVQRRGCSHLRGLHDLCSGTEVTGTGWSIEPPAPSKPGCTVETVWGPQPAQSLANTSVCGERERGGREREREGDAIMLKAAYNERETQTLHPLSGGGSSNVRHHNVLFIEIYLNLIDIWR